MQIQPIDRLPPELWQLTFAQYLERPDWDTNYTLRSGRAQNCTPFHLSSVCPRWYSLVVRNPHLWSNIHIFGPQECDVPRFTVWLERSGKELLTLSIHEDFSSSPPSFPDMPRQMSWPESDYLTQHQQALVKIIKLAVGVSERWRDVTLSLSEIVGQTVFQTEGFDDKRFPHLLRFDVDMRDTGESSHGFPPSQPTIAILSQRLCTSARLRSARWKSNVDYSIKDYVPFERLTSLSLPTITDAEATSILYRCQELKRLEFPDYRASLAVPTSPSIILPNLEQASLGFLQDLTSAHPFFSTFVTPALQELRLERGFGRSTTDLRVIGSGGQGVGDVNGWKSLIAFLKESGCTLKKLAYCPNIELSAVEVDVMRANLKDTVFSGLVEYPKTRRGGGEMSRWEGY